MIEPLHEWRLPEPLTDEPRLPGFGLAVATLLARRGITDEIGLAALLPDADSTTLHPIELMADAVATVDRLDRAVRDGERIAIWGDYDADGMTAIAIWMVALRALGADPLRYVPSRSLDGYGVSVRGLEHLRDEGARIVVTCDCGISNVHEADVARSLGLELIVTDHHLPGARLPAAALVVDPHRDTCEYPNKDLTGAGIAFKLATALLERRGVVAADLAAYAAIGTVADVAPLLGENRAIVRRGLGELVSTRRAGLRALVARAVSDTQRVTARDLAFGVAPRLNAAGRISEAELAIGLMLAEDADEAARLADELDGVNRERQALTRAAVEAALLSSADTAFGGAPLVVRDDTWPPGIIGLIAGKLADHLGCPVAAVTSVDGELRGSVRAPGDFHVARALAACADHLLKLGGHPAAGGFSLDPASFDSFQQAFGALPRPFPVGASVSTPPADRPVVDVHLVLPAREVTWSLIDELERLAPFGAGNAEPVVAITGLSVADVRRAGASGGHLVIRLLRGYESIDAIQFDVPPTRAAPEPGMRLDVVATIERDDWLGLPRFRLRLLDYAEAAASPLASRRRTALAVGGTEESAVLASAS